MCGVLQGWTFLLDDNFVLLKARGGWVLFNMKRNHLTSVNFSRVVSNTGELETVVFYIAVPCAHLYPGSRGKCDCLGIRIKVFISLDYSN